MPRFPNFQFDRFSFLLGLITATLLWWIFSKFRPMLPQYWAMVKKYIQDVNQQNLAGAEQTLRRSIIRRSQRLHLASPLFALNEVLINPKLIAPPPSFDPGSQSYGSTIATQTLPYIPDWPELLSPLGASTLSPLEAMSLGSHIAIIGQPGTGKSVALAHLASQLARGDAETGELKNALPLLLHIADLDLSDFATKDPIQTLVKAVTSQINIVAQPQVTRHVNIVLREKIRKPILLLDGLDELPREELKNSTAFLKALLEKLPELQVITTASSEHLDGLIMLGFYPLGIAAWSHNERVEFIQRWGDLWNAQILPEAKKHVSTIQSIDPLLINNWLFSELSLETPLELTLKAWSAYAGDLNGSSLLSLLDTYLSRYIPSKSLLPALDILGHRFVRLTKWWMDIDEMEQVLSSYQMPEALATGEESEAEKAESAKKTQSRKKKSDRDAIVTQGEKIISALSNNGVVSQHSNNRVRFINPILTGYLASTRISPETPPEETSAMIQEIDWTTNSQTLRFAAACSSNPAWFGQILQDINPPFYKNLLIVGHWLADAPVNTEWRSNVLRSFVSLLQNDTLSIGLRARVAAAFITSRDPSTPKLFRQLLTSPSDVVRQIAVIACGALSQPQMINDILELLVDPSPLVRNAACLAISAIPGDTALSTLVEIMMQGDEDSRQAAAEALALNASEGKQVLEEISVVEDLLARRAAVFGLVQVKGEWARKLLEKIAIEDGQWVVRNAATQALDEISKPNPSIPRPLPPASENAWLLAFAGKLGMGIRPGSPATEVLLAALKSGTIEEQEAALSYLRREPSDGVVSAVYNLLYGEQEKLHEPAMVALWWILLSGFEIPSPAKFGLG